VNEKKTKLYMKLHPSTVTFLEKLWTCYEGCGVGCERHWIAWT